MGSDSSYAESTQNDISFYRTNVEYDSPYAESTQNAEPMWDGFLLYIYVESTQNGNEETRMKKQISKKSLKV
jgi:hypothetical protein